MYVKMKVSVILICVIFGIAHGRVDSSSFSCAVDEFSCRNGECIGSTSVCDGTLHCKDGSDESLHACDFGLASSAKRLSSIGVRIRRSGETVRYSSCVVPPQPKNGMRKLNRFSCDEDEDCDVAEGSSLNAGSQLTYVCDPGFRLEGNSHVYCARHGEWSLIPVCKRIKCEALSTASTYADCSRRGKRTSCVEPVLPGTKAEVSCRAGYKLDTNSAINRRDRIECDISGEWHPKPIICIPACGVATDRKRPNVLNGTTANVGDFPWHATLYEEVYKEKGPVKEFRCGATVIHTKLVLTAAHCVYYEGTRSTLDPNSLHVATGNVFREFDSPLHDSNIVQKSPVRNMWRYCWYQGLLGNYVGDIALLELQKPFTFSSILVPACVDISGLNHRILEPGSLGRVAGFGMTQYSAASAILQTITVPYVTYSDCKNSRQGLKDEVLISNDKFCGGRINGTQAVCSGDSGGGLVFRQNDLWYIMGVVSVALGVDTRDGEPRCETSAYTLYTDVATYIDWIRDITYGLESNGYFPSCDLECTPVNSESTMTKCYLSGRWAICDSPVPSQTKARILCREGYVKSTTGQDSIKCTPTGKWTPEPVACVPLATTPTVSPIMPNVTIAATPIRRGLIAGQKCAEYASFILPNSSRTIGDTQCTDTRGPGQFRDSRHAGTNEFPYIARIGFQLGLISIAWKCGATLISENYVISSASCAQHPEYGLATWLQFGHINYTEFVGSYVSERRIIQIISHPNFRIGSIYNDVALYKMDPPVTFDESILPACLYRLPDVDTITVTGLLRENHQSLSDTSLSFSTLNTSVVDQARCDAIYADTRGIPDGIVDESIICVNFNTPIDCVTKLTGSALILPSNDRLCMKELVGVASMPGLCNTVTPGAYARVYHHIRWIEDIVWPEV